MVAAPLDRAGLLARSDLAGRARVLSLAQPGARIEARLRFVEIVKDNRPRLLRWPRRTAVVRLRSASALTLGEWTDAGAYPPGRIVTTHLAWNAEAKAYETVWWNAVWPEAPAPAFQRVAPLPPPPPDQRRAMAESSDVVAVARVTRVERETPWHPLMAELRLKRIVKACDRGPPLAEGATCLVRLREHGPWPDKDLFRAGEDVIANLDWNPYGFGFLVTTGAKAVWTAGGA
jgi:hypothetical protein